MTNVRGKILRAGDVSELAVLFLQHVVAAVLDDAALDRLAGHFRTVCAALRGSLVLPNVSTGRGGSACLVLYVAGGAARRCAWSPAASRTTTAARARLCGRCHGQQ
jgi:hypothetical protein